MPYPNRMLYALTVFATLFAPSGLRWYRRWYRRHRRAARRLRRHHYKQDQARRVLAKLHTIPILPQRLAYLRKIDPLTFEEMVLEAFARHGFEIHRNPRYSCDGGLDGAVRRGGKLYLIQAKRYAEHIHAPHVAAFGRLLDARRCSGFFCHTGRTGKAARTKAVAHSGMTILSGQRLLDFLDIQSTPNREPAPKQSKILPERDSPARQDQSSGRK